MCGIVGLLQPYLLSREAEPVLRAMMDRLHHRGTDDSPIVLRKRSDRMPGYSGQGRFGPIQFGRVETCPHRIRRSSAVTRVSS
jgi:hypothetical protein